jgi:hypothetical protein
MARKAAHTLSHLPKGAIIATGAGALCLILMALLFLGRLTPLRYDAAAAAMLNNSSSTPSTNATPTTPVVPPLDTHAYDVKLLSLAHVASTTPWYQYFLTGTTTATTTWKRGAWPVKAAYPNANPLLPFSRIVAYYGNFYSKGMGVLGQYPPDVMLGKLADAVAQWKAADPSTPVIHAIDYIAVTAQGSAGADGKYRLRMPDSQIDHALDLANEVHGIVILDVQVGLSTLQVELPLLQKYLSMPNVHLAIDPEFSMKDGVRPGREIGTFSSADINYAASYLASLVQQNNLSPKVLVVHRFTEEMVTGYKNIKPLPEVQIVVDMDGWGFPAKKINTYNSVVSPEPIQFTGFKLFYKNDLLKPSTGMLTPAQILKLTPSPSFIQYQ